MARPVPRERIVLHDDEVVAQMKAEFAPEAEIAQELRERHDLQRWAQRGYERAPNRPYTPPAED